MRMFFAALCSLILIPVTSAHGDQLSLEQQRGDILIDIGFGKDLPTVGSSITYSFDLFNTKKPDAYVFEPFTDVHVRIFRERQELLNRTIPNNGSDVPTLTYPYKETGDYSMTVVYERKGKESVDASFGYRVVEKGDNPAEPINHSVLKVGPVGAVVIGLVVLLVIVRVVFLLRKKR